MGCVVLIVGQSVVAQSSLLSNVGGVIGDVLANSTSIVQDPLTRSLCDLTSVYSCRFLRLGTEKIVKQIFSQL